jgi:hypothetical protein
MATKEPEAGPEHPVIAAMKRAPRRVVGVDLD